MRFNVLGPLEVWRGDDRLELGPPQRRVLLARLILANDRAVELARLREALWGERPMSGAASTVHAHISRLRAVLEPHRKRRGPARVLVSESAGYALRVPGAARDTVCFEQDLGRARRLLADGDPTAALQWSERALEWWRGPALSEVAERLFATREASRLTEARREAAELRLIALLELGLHGPAVAGAMELTAEHPLHETAWVLLLRALYFSGRPAEALRQYDRVRALLKEELGLAPGPALRAAQLAVLRHDAGQLLPRAREHTSLTSASRPLPSGALVSLPGRSAELAQLTRTMHAAMSGRAAWAVVSGGLGSGKTRLAEELARHAAKADATVVWTRCGGEVAGAEREAPFWVALQLLRQLLPERAPSADSLLPRPSSVSAHDRAAQAAERLAAFEGIARELSRRLSGRPTLCLIDDMQWIDPDSCELLAFLAVHLRDVPLTVVCNVRDARHGGAVGDLLMLLARQDSSHLALAPLTEGEAEQAVRQWHLQGQSAPDASRGTPGLPRVASELHRRSAGNPFFLTELLRTALDHQGRPTPHVPPAVQHIATMIADRMPPAVRCLLDDAATAGDVLDPPLLARVRGTSVDTVLDLLDEAVTTPLLTWEASGREQGRYRFTAPVVRDAVLAALPPKRRRRPHRDMTSALPTHHGEAA